MKKNLLKSIIAVMMVAFVAVAANAQTAVSDRSGKIDLFNAQACGEYLSQHPGTVLEGEYSTTNKDGKSVVVTRKVYFDNEGRLTAFNDTVPAKKVVTSVKREATDVVVVSKVKTSEGEAKDTTTWSKASTSELPFAVQESIYRGETQAFDPKYKDYNGNLRQKFLLSVLGGGSFNKGFSPMVSARVGYESRLFLFELQGNYAFNKKLTELAEAKGKYGSFSAQFNAGWKFLQEPNGKYFIAIVGGVGYGYYTTDGNEIDARSFGYGIEGELALRGSYSVTKWLNVVLEGGYRVISKVNHDQDQDLGNGGAFVRGGVAIPF